MSNEQQEQETVNRRDFLGLAAAVSAGVALLLAFIGTIKFPKLALLPDVSSAFKIGKPEDFPIGNSKVFENKNVEVFRDKTGIFAISLICTHLGCIVKAEKTGYSCPCHGSIFDTTGNVKQGPAPKALIWLDVSLNPAGKLIVDAGKPVMAGTKLAV
jgi:cytochrome b6-f complex iron-sulfur subunit